MARRPQLMTLKLPTEEAQAARAYAAAAKMSLSGWLREAVRYYVTTHNHELQLPLQPKVVTTVLPVARTYYPAAQDPGRHRD